jgi:tRNA (guanine-N7-)-methyltransferase
MQSPAPAREKVNPYSEWIYDHPESLLPHPTQELLREKRTRAPGGSGRLVVELGSGSGNFLVSLAEQTPEDHLVGFELRYKRLVKAARKLEKRGLRNVWLLRALAEQFDQFFAPSSVDALHINFPDPWPKVSQWKKRLINARLVERLEGALKPGGSVSLKTDHSGYFLHALALWRDRPGWQIIHFSNDLHRYGPPAPNVRTEFEQLFAAKKKAIFFLTVVKTGMRD